MAIYIVVACFIIFDVLTGLVKALFTEGINSTKLRLGLYHKLSEVLAVAGSALIEYGAKYINLGVELPVLSIVSVYICIAELVSILENLSEMNPTLARLFSPYLEKLKPGYGTTTETKPNEPSEVPQDKRDTSSDDRNITEGEPQDNDLQTRY